MAHCALGGDEDEITAGNVLGARVFEAPSSGQPLKVDTGNDTLLEERDSIGISIRLPKGEPRTTYALRLFVCSEVRYTLQPTDRYYLGEPGNPMMAVLPMFTQSSEHTPHLNNEAGYFYGKPVKYGVPDPIPLMGGSPHYRALFDRQYLDGNMAIARFNAADWPAAQGDIARMISDVLSRLMTYIEQQASQ